MQNKPAQLKNKNKGIGKIFQGEVNQKKAGLTMLISGKMEFWGVLPRKHLHTCTRIHVQDVHCSIICDNDNFKGN